MPRPRACRGSFSRLSMVIVNRDDWLEPYERYLPETSREYRHAWGEEGGRAARVRASARSRTRCEVHAGSAYVEAVEPNLDAAGAELVDELEGLSFGRRLSWYHQHAAGERRAVLGGCALHDHGLGDDPRRVSGNGRARSAFSRGCTAGGSTEQARPTSPRGWDTQSTRDSSMPGLAGRPKGGRASSNTLCGRWLPTMRLGKRNEFSTFAAASVLNSRPHE